MGHLKQRTKGKYNTECTKYINLPSKNIYEIQNVCVFMLLSAYATHLHTHFSVCTNT